MEQNAFEYFDIDIEPNRPITFRQVSDRLQIAFNKVAMTTWLKNIPVNDTDSATMLGSIYHEQMGKAVDSKRLVFNFLVDKKLQAIVTVMPTRKAMLKMTESEANARIALQVGGYTETQDDVPHTIHIITTAYSNGSYDNAGTIWESLMEEIIKVAANLIALSKTITDQDQ